MNLTLHRDKRMGCRSRLCFAFSLAALASPCLSGPVAPLPQLTDPSLPSEHKTTRFETEQDQTRFLLEYAALSIGFVIAFGVISKVKAARYKRFEKEGSDQVLSMQEVDELASAALKTVEPSGWPKKTKGTDNSPAAESEQVRRGPYPWGGAVFPSHNLGVHFALMGAPGSGKTVSMRMLLGAVLRDQPSPRVLLFDPKGDEVWPILRGMNIPASRIILLNPFDKRSWAWDIARDFKTPAQAQQLAAMLVPADASAANPYFWQTARLIVTEVIKVFQDAQEARDVATAAAIPLVHAYKVAEGKERAACKARLMEAIREAWTGSLDSALLAASSEHRIQRLLKEAMHSSKSWTLNDVLEATSSVKRLSLVLSATHGGQECKATHLDNPGKKTSGSVLSTLATKLQRFSAVARLWARTRRSHLFSLNDWLDGNCILVVGIDEEHEEAMKAVNELLFRRIADQVVHLPERRADSAETKKPETWFFLDELRSIGKLEKLPNLLNKGRTKGARAVLGFQDLNGLLAVYDQHVAKELLATCENFGVLALTSPESREWASQFFSSYYEMVTTRSQSLGGGSHSFSIAEQMHLMPAVPANVFADLPPASKRDGIFGMFYIRAISPWLGHISAEKRDAWLDDFAKEAQEPGFSKRPASMQQRCPWHDDDAPEYIRLDMLERKVRLERGTSSTSDARTIEF